MADVVDDRSGDNGGDVVEESGVGVARPATPTVPVGESSVMEGEPGRVPGRWGSQVQGAEDGGVQARRAQAVGGQMHQYGPGNQPVKQLADPHRVTTVVSIVVCVIGLIGVAVFMLLSNGSTETYTGFGTSVESEVVYVDMLAAAVVSGVIAAAGFVSAVVSDVASRQWRERHGLAK